MATSFAFLVLFVLMKLIHNLWWKPKSIERRLRKQGIRGTSYRPFKGDTPEMKKLAKASSSKPISLNTQIARRVIPFYHNMVKRYGKVSVCWFGSSPKLIIADAELIRLLLEDKKGELVHPPLNPLVNLQHLGFAALEGQEWSKRRRLITPAFHLDKLKGMVPAFSRSCCNLVEQWQKLVMESQGKCEIDVAPQLSTLACDAISRTAFGSSYQQGKQIFELQKQQSFLVREAYNSIYIPGFRFVPTRKNKRRYQIYNQIKAILKNMIRQREDAMQRGEVEGELDLLGLLLQCKEQSINDLTIDDVIEECKMFYIAGQETTATLLTWTMICLSIYPDWQDKARHEVLEICGTAKPDFGAINRFKIIPMILDEVLRLFPSLPFISRYTTRETRVGNLLIPAGVELCLLVMNVHYDADYWGEDANEFKPERFCEGVSKASKDQMAFFPFGWGPRICVAQKFALIEAKMALAMILPRFSFQLSPSYTHAPCLRITVKPQYGAPINLRPI
ncbi:cytochrome P450 CYP72A219-like [Neltuma alba]|uniref:cytochrome P450 CYP72A219-like n=1 Tax=Neltuma alba TaxID=207710 RepID=UPI0010A31224|nr:cytochrome P450 CYP72A219-like [Prosopis alba]XP_028789313.1 cytochrome P450 CYP72A219-like [Prosopis alba]